MRRSPLTPIFKPDILYGSISVGTTPVAARVKDLGVATETDTARTVGARHVITAGVASETDTAVAVGSIYGAPGTVLGKGFNLDAASCSGATSFSFTANIAFSVGDWIVVTVAADNAGTSGVNPITTMTDAQGNTYTKRVDENCTQGAADDGISLAMFTAPITTALATTDLITANFSPSTTRKSVTAMRVRPASGRTLSFLTAGSANFAANHDPSITTSSLARNDYLIGGLARDDRDATNGDSDTTRGTWVEHQILGCDGGSDDASVLCECQAKIVTDFGTQTWNPDVPTGGGPGPGLQDNAIGYVVLRQV